MRVNKRFLTVGLCCLLVFGVTACNENLGEYEIRVTDSEYGTVDTVRRADEGELVTVDVREKDGYGIHTLLVNGVPVSGNSFVMPDADVVVSVSYARLDGAYTVTTEESMHGATVADLFTANAGDTVTLTTYCAYASQVSRYLVNGLPIAGSSFTMPDSDVTVTTEYDMLIPQTPVVIKAIASYQQATSYWYASYGETGITIKAVVDDNIVFTAYNAGIDIGFLDNVEFIVGYGTDKDLSSTHFNVLVSGDGRCRFRQYIGGWTGANASGVSFSCEPCDVFEHGFNGYIATVTIPYSRFGVNREQALGNMTLGVSMRNSLNALKTSWASFSGLDCEWGNGKKHCIINEDGSFSPNVSQSDYLVVGDGLLNGVSAQLSSLGSVGSSIYADRTIAKWTQEIDVIAAYHPQHVVFSAGAKELTTKSVLLTFDDMRRFIEEFRVKMPEARLTVVSAIPTLGTNILPDKTVAFNSMVQSYVDTMPNVDYIDVCSSVYSNGVVNESLYVSERTFYDYGTNLLCNALLQHFGQSTPSGDGAVWGSKGVYLATQGWQESDNALNLSAGGSQFTFLKNYNGGDFDFTVKMSLNGTIYNGDAYPKFGIVLNGVKASRYYFVYADMLTSNRVGVVTRPYNGYQWTGASDVAIEGLEYVKPSYVTLRLVRIGSQVTFTVNGQEIYSGNESMLGDGEPVLGLFSFNLPLTVTEWEMTVPSGQEVS